MNGTIRNILLASKFTLGAVLPVWYSFSNFNQKSYVIHRVTCRIDRG